MNFHNFKRNSNFQYLHKIYVGMLLVFDLKFTMSTRKNKKKIRSMIKKNKFEFLDTKIHANIATVNERKPI